MYVYIYINRNIYKYINYIRISVYNSYVLLISVKVSQSMFLLWETLIRCWVSQTGVIILPTQTIHYIVYKRKIPSRLPYSFALFETHQKKGAIWMFPKIGVPQNGWWKSWKTLLKWMIWGYPYFWKHPFNDPLANPCQIDGLFVLLVDLFLHLLKRQAATGRIFCQFFSGGAVWKKPCYVHGFMVR